MKKNHISQTILFGFLACAIVTYRVALSDEINKTDPAVVEQGLRDELVQAKKNSQYEHQARVLIDLAEHYYANAQTTKANALYSELEQTAALVDKPRVFIDVYRYLAHQSFRTEQFKRASEYFSVAVDAARKLDDNALLADLLNEQGVADARSGDFSFAGQAFDESEQLAEKLRIADLRLTALINGCKAKLDGKISRELDACLKRASQLNDASVENEEKIERYLSLGMFYQRGYRELNMPAASWRQSAFQQFESARRAAEKQKNVAKLAFAFGYIGQLYADEGRYDEALSLTRKAVSSAQQVQFGQAIYRFQLQQAHILRLQQNFVDALKVYRHVQSSMLAQQQAIIGTDSRGYDHVFKPVMKESIDLLVYLAGKNEKKRQEYLAEAIRAIELMRQFEFNSFYRNTLQIVPQNDNPIAANTALIYSITFPERTDFFAMVNGTIHHHAIQVSEATLRRRAESFFQSLAKKETSDDYKVHSSQWFNWIVFPMQAFLKEQQIETLIFLPEEPLHLIPLAALLDGKTFLVERYNVLTAKALSLTKIDHQTSAKKKISVVGLKKDGWKKLGGLLTQHLALNAPDISALSGRQSRDLVFVAEPIRLENFANRSDRSTTAERIWPDIESQLNAELLILQNGEFSRDSDTWNYFYFLPQGMGAEMFIPRVWRNEDEQSDAFLQKFFELYFNYGLNGRDALQRAQRYFITQGKHPHDWAGYIFIDG